VAAPRYIKIDWWYNISMAPTRKQIAIEALQDRRAILLEQLRSVEERIEEVEKE